MPHLLPSLTLVFNISSANLSLSSRAGAIAFIAAFSGAATGQARAQDTTPYVPAPPPDVQKVINGIGDLDILKALVPLKLTVEQRDKLLPVMKQYVTEAGIAQRKADYDALRALSASVTKARDAALQGDVPTAETEATVLKMFNGSEDSLRAARKKAIAALFPLMKESLTPAQKDEVEKQVSRMLGGRRPVPAAFAKDPSKAPTEAVQDLALSTFIDRIFLLDRTVVLLGKIKTAPAAPPLPPKEDAPAAKPAEGAAATP